MRGSDRKGAGMMRNRRQIIGYVDARSSRKDRREAYRTMNRELRRPSAVDDSPSSKYVEELDYVGGPRRHGPVVSDPGAGGFRSTKRIRQATHRFSSVEAAGIYPFLTGTRTPTLGAALGVDCVTEALWCFDPWRWYEEGRITSTGVLIMGGYRMGKSFFLKRLITNMIGLGRQAINTSDSKGEHGALAEALGGTVFRVGATGSELRINPLDEGHRPDSMPSELWEVMTQQRRSLLLQQIAEILLTQSLTPEERTTLDWALAVAIREDKVPTIRKVHTVLGELVEGVRDPRELGDVRHSAKRMWHTFRRLVVGDLSGMFEDESTVQIDADSPYTVFDTYSMSVRGDDALAITQVVTQTWVQSILQDKTSGRRFLVAREEGWRDMNSVAALEAQRLQQKLAGEFGICQLLVVHEGGDFKSVGDEGSKLRELAEQLAKGFAVKISFAQEIGQLDASARAVGLTDAQRELVRGLHKGQCVVATGEDATLLDTYPISTDWEKRLFNTDHHERIRAQEEELLEAAERVTEDVTPAASDTAVSPASDTWHDTAKAVDSEVTSAGMGEFMSSVLEPGVSLPLLDSVTANDTDDDTVHATNVWGGK